MGAPKKTTQPTVCARSTHRRLGPTRTAHHRTAHQHFFFSSISGLRLRIQFWELEFGIRIRVVPDGWAAINSGAKSSATGLAEQQQAGGGAAVRRGWGISGPGSRRHDRCVWHSAHRRNRPQPSLLVSESPSSGTCPPPQGATNPRRHKGLPRLIRRLCSARQPINYNKPLVIITYML